jgi:hypothetical protein
MITVGPLMMGLMMTHLHLDLMTLGQMVMTMGWRKSHCVHNTTYGQLHKTMMAC